MAEIIKTEILDLKIHLERAVELILAGKVVAFPTDTVYGLGADPFNLAAVVEVYRIKGRSFSHPLPLLVNSVDQAIDLTSGPPGVFFDLAKKYWPGPLTMVVPASSLVPLKVTGNTGNVGLRWPRAPVAVALISAAGRPLTGTSANRTNHRACRTAGEVDEQIGNRIPLILDGGSTEDSAASTVIDLTADPPRIVRPGPIAENELKELLS
ncbi:MAG TPA: L-threonylcarbamoyladenylate synthase [Terriglobia bacterium]|nr:L-threonylcarbamoyladenylate synthase [Terriglobia bacterium]